MTATARGCWIAGASGLVGRELLQRLSSVGPGRIDVLARRPVAAPAGAGDRLRTHLVDFAALPAALPATDDVYIALGTTIKTAGSEAAFRAVDFDAVVAVARAGRAAGATRLAVVSALGADAGSRVFYNRVKGDMEAAIARLGYESVVVARPSLLIGDRASLGQPVRSGEVWAERLLAPVMRFVPASIRPIAAGDVAAALIAAMAEAAPGVRVLSSAAMQQAGARDGRGRPTPRR